MPPEIYIGTDIVDISRIRELITKHPNRFINRTYSTKEQLYCKSKADPIIHYAGRFAAKESIKKALMTSGIKSAISWVDMEIISRQDGEPIVQLHGELFLGLSCKVSISHTQEIAIASAIIVK